MVSASRRDRRASSRRPSACLSRFSLLIAISILPLQRTSHNAGFGLWFRCHQSCAQHYVGDIGLLACKVERGEENVEGEVLTGSLKAQDDSTVRRYRAVYDTWRLVDLSVDIAESAARLRVSLGPKIADVIQAASALAINADALVTHDRDFGHVRILRVLS
jgi:hypothetical protein